MGYSNRHKSAARSRRRERKKRDRYEGPGRFYRPEAMEMGCVRPGHWTVEGYDVERHRADGKDWWHVFTRRAVQVQESEPWSVHETFHGKRRSLTEACELVWELMVSEGRAS